MNLVNQEQSKPGASRRKEGRKIGAVIYEIKRSNKAYVYTKKQ